MKQYYQCKLRLVDLPQSHTTAWIEKRGAKVGARVELLPDHVFWEVMEVFDHGIPEDVLRETQQQRRTPPPSIRDTKKDRRQQTKT